MGNIYVFVNQKGGVGKTTSAINIGAFLAEEGKNVLLVDFDSQANLSSGLGLSGMKPGVYELISGEASLTEVVKPTAIPNLVAIPSDIDLSGAAVELIEQEQRDFFLRNALEPARSRYDYILIDCPPSLGILTINGLVAADHVLIPMQCEYFALEGLSLLLQTVKRINRLNPTIDIGGIFFTMFDSRIKLSQEVVRQVSARFKKKVFNTVAPRNVRLSEAPSYGQPISLYDPQCAGAKAYRRLAQELIQRG
ncbi:MAG: ParA family protein [Treponema sp.]|jgi:chromosome partitioning protein|nr:ParA family protein [Treponema sp.]